jgi:hypothetical protein
MLDVVEGKPRQRMWIYVELLPSVRTISEICLACTLSVAVAIEII